MFRLLKYLTVITLSLLIAVPAHGHGANSIERNLSRNSTIVGPLTDSKVSIAPLDYGLEAARGNITGVKTINKYGKNIEIDAGTTADIWSGGLATGGSSLI